MLYFNKKAKMYFIRIKKNFTFDCLIYPYTFKHLKLCQIRVFSLDGDQNKKNQIGFLGKKYDILNNPQGP